MFESSSYSKCIDSNSVSILTTFILIGGLVLDEGNFITLHQ